MKISALFIFIAILFSSTSYALSPETRLADEASEQRAMKIFLQVRCLACQGQVIESSDTEFSFGMRKLIRQKISAGKSDEEIKTELTNEFGEDILIEPKISGATGFFLWFLPLIFAIIFIYLFRHLLAHRQR
jgi:cytochrome c-type biogenesis protein CcmH